MGRLIKVDYGNVGGGVDVNTLLSLFNNATIIESSASGQVTPVISGKTYLCFYSRGNNSTSSFVSGGTELYHYYYQNASSSSAVKCYIGIIKATSNTLVFAGNNNNTYLVQLD